MRLFDLEIDGQKYPACCGLRALAQNQKKNGSLSAFEKKLLPYQEQTEKGHDEKLLDVDAMDIQMIMETTELFLKEGAFLTGEKVETDKILCSASNPFGLVLQLFDIYVMSMKPDNEENVSKNRTSQRMSG